MRAAATTALALIGGLLIACGDDGFSGEEARIAGVIERAHEASAERDRTTLCRELIAPSQVEDVRNCEQELPITSRRDAPSARIESIKIDGDAARVIYEDGGFAGLVREGGQWYLDIER